MAPRIPAPRGFTLNEVRSLKVERISLYVVFLVALVAMIVSFVALTWLGGHMRLGIAAPLIPLMLDGFAVACSFGIVRSQAEGEGVRDRLSEWIGLSIALALSVLGNVYHVLNVVPVWLMVLVAGAIPTIVAYGIHVYGRALDRGISSHVLADNPNEIVFDLQRVGDTPPAPAPRVRAPRVQAQEPRTPAPSTPEPSTPPALTPEPPVPAQDAVGEDVARETAYQQYAAHLLAGGPEWVAHEVGTRCGVDRSGGSDRKSVV